MRIAVDIDGVLNYVEKFQLEYGIPWFRERGYEVVNPNGFDITDIFGCSQELRNEFWKSTTKNGVPIKDALIFEMARNSQMRPGFKELLSGLYNEGHNVYIVTERYGTGKQGLFSSYNRKLVYDWLKDNGIDIPKERIIFVPEGKTKEEIYKEMNFEVAMEDNVKNIKAIENNEKLYAIVFNASYNKDYENDKVFRVDLPIEALDKVKEIEKIKDEIRHEQEIVRPNQFFPSTGVPSVDRVYRQYITEEDENIDVPAMKYIDYLRKCAEDFPNVTLLLDEYGHSYTYSEFLNELVPLYAKAFLNYGVKEGDPVVISLPNLIAMQAAKFALADIGAIPVLANPLSNVQEFTNYLSTEVKGRKVKTALIFNRSYYTVVEACKNEKVKLNHIVNVGVNSDFGFPLNVGYFIKESKNDPDPKDIKNNEIVSSLKEFLKGAENISSYLPSKYVEGKAATIYFTGGTTGVEKGVITTDKNAIATAMAFTKYIKGDKVGKLTINAMPFFHVFGDNQIFFFAACNGMTNLLITKFKKEDVPKIFEKYGEVVNCNGVPAFLQAIYSKLIDEGRLSSVENMIGGGAAYTNGFIDDMNIRLKRAEAPGRVGNGYGSTETDGAVTYTYVGGDEPSCIGIPTPGSHLKIVKQGTTEEIGYDEIGEICARGPSIMMEYLNNPEETQKVLKTHSDGYVWLHTGDLGYVKKNGKYYLTDRIKRMIIVSGENVYPNRIEELIMSKYSDIVSQCIVIGRADVNKGEVPLVKVLLKPGIVPSEEISNAIINTCKETFNNKKYWPVQLDFVKQIPLTKMNKPDYKVLNNPDLIIDIEKSSNTTTKKDKLHDNYDGNKFYKLVHDVYSPIYKSPVLGRKITYIGAENIPETGAGIVAMNHLNAQDQNAIIANNDRIVSLPAKKEYFDNKLGNFFMSNMEMVPVDRFGDVNYAKELIKGLIYTIPCENFERDNAIEKEIMKFVDSVDPKIVKTPKQLVDVVNGYIIQNHQDKIGVEAIKKISSMPTEGKQYGYGRALKAGEEITNKLKAGRLVGVFPEGTRNKDFIQTGELLPFHNGTVYWARDSFAPIIPTAITGDHTRGGEILVRSGEPIKIDSNLNDSEVREATNDLRDKIYELVLMNLIDQETIDNDKALGNAIEKLKRSKDPKDQQLIEMIYNRLNENKTERNENFINNL